MIQQQAPMPPCSPMHSCPPPPLPGWVQAWEQAGSVELLGAADARLASETEADKQHRWGRGRTEFCFWGGGGSGFGAVMLLEQQ